MDLLLQLSMQRDNHVSDPAVRCLDVAYMEGAISMTPR